MTPLPASSPLPPTSTPLPFALIDANAVFEGICFESVNDAAGRTFLLRTPDELLALFDGSDNSQFCDRPAERRPFDFATVDGQPTRVILGTWSAASGCVARHEVTGADIDDAARTFTLRVRLIVEGACPYELVRPFWVAVPDANRYVDIRLVIEEPVIFRDG